VRIQVRDDLPAALTDADALATKLLRDREKLLALVRLAQHDGDRKAFIHEYFGLRCPTG
jgi:ATP-dependent DNA helicase RecQ